MSDITFTRLPGFTPNGHSRYVCHYHVLLTEAEKNDPENIQRVYKGMSQGYIKAIARARLIGGRKYRAKWYGGGIVFTEYENVIRKYIIQLVAEATEKEAQS